MSKGRVEKLDLGNICPLLFREKQPQVQGAAAAQAKETWEELLHIEGQEGGRDKIPFVQVRSRICTFLEQPWRDMPCPR